MKADLKKLRADYERALRDGDVERAGELASDIMELVDQSDPRRNRKKDKDSDSDKE